MLWIWGNSFVYCVSICSIDCKRDCRDDYVFEKETVKHCIVFLDFPFGKSWCRAFIYSAYIWSWWSLGVKCEVVFVRCLISFYNYIHKQQLIWLLRPSTHIILQVVRDEMCIYSASAAASSTSIWVLVLSC